MKIVSVVIRFFIFLAYYIVAETYVKELFYYPQPTTPDLVGWNLFLDKWVWVFVLMVLTELTWLAIHKKKGSKPLSWQPPSNTQPERTIDVVIPRPTVEREKNSSENLK